VLLLLLLKDLHKMVLLLMKVSHLYS